MSTATSRAAGANVTPDDSDDDRAFYSRIWGDEDIQIGIYRSRDEPIRDASRRTVEEMASWLPDLTSDHTVLDIAAGYGGAARYLALHRGCRVTCVNLSSAQNQRNRQRNERLGLKDKIEVVRGGMEHLPVPSNTYDVVWSRDAIFHSADRLRVLKEVRRALRPGGRFIFTDLMQADDCPPSVLDPVYARLQLTSLSSPGSYRSMLNQLGFREQRSADLSAQLVLHHMRVSQELEGRREELAHHTSAQYLGKIRAGLRHWIRAGRNGHACWGIYCFMR